MSTTYVHNTHVELTIINGIANDVKLSWKTVILTRVAQHIRSSFCAAFLDFSVPKIVTIDTFCLCVDGKSMLSIKHF